MPETTKAIERKIRGLGLSDDAIKAAWPKWWSEDAEGSEAAINDLKFSLARKLGISPPSLFDEGDATFVWPGKAKFKGLTTETETDTNALVSFGMSIARLLLSCRKEPTSSFALHPLLMREVLFRLGAKTVGAWEIMELAQRSGIPVIYLRTFPLKAKRMTAMAVRIDEEYAILLGRDTHYLAPASFYIAHELGHIALGHLSSGSALVDMDLEGQTRDTEEAAADQYALALLTGRTEVVFDVNRAPRNAAELAHAVIRASVTERIDPGVLAMCYGYERHQWPLAMATLKLIYKDTGPTWKSINQRAAESLDFSKLTDDNTEFLSTVMGL